MADDKEQLETDEFEDFSDDLEESPADLSAMDGYAVRSADLTASAGKNARLTLGGEAGAGDHPPDSPFEPPLPFCAAALVEACNLRFS